MFIFVSKCIRLKVSHTFSIRPRFLKIQSMLSKKRLFHSCNSKYRPYLLALDSSTSSSGGVDSLASGPDHCKPLIRSYKPLFSGIPDFKIEKLLRSYHSSAVKILPQSQLPLVRIAHNYDYKPILAGKVKVPLILNVSFQSPKAKQAKHVVERKEKSQGDITIGKKVAQAGKDATYTAVVIGGLGITGLLFLAVGRELFSGQSPSGVYGRALKACKKNDEVLAAFGTPIKGYGEMTRRGRRRHVRHTVYETEGVKHMRLKFYIEGPDKKGTVHAEVKQNERGKYEFRYIFVDVDDYPPRTFIIEDHR